MKQKKYIDIERIKEVYAASFKVGEHITIQSKIDGSNSSISYDVETDSVLAFSRRKVLDFDNTLNGFWNFVQTLPVDKIKEVLGTRYIIFGEWMTKHSVTYPDSMYQKFYMYDVYDTEIEQYLPQIESHKFYDKLSDFLPEYVHTLYDGPFVSWEHIYDFLKENTYGESPCMEGIVIKRQDNLNSKSSRNPFYVKIVNDQFAEVHKSTPKTVDPEKMAQREAEMANVATVVTKRRTIKLLQKFVEDNLIPEDWGGESMKQISKLLSKAMFEDCKKEEPDVVAANENFGKFCATLSMQYAREIMNDKSKFL